MKKLCLILFFTVFSLAVHAEDNPKPYSQMTLQELEAVDTKALDKAAKKEHKSAVKAAKKAEKARVRAEKKRLKAEAKARQAQEKALQKKLKAVNKAYAKTRAVHDEFIAEKQVLGPQYFVETDGLTFAPVPKYALISVLHTNSLHTLQLFVHSSSSINGLDTDYLDFKGISPETYARRKGMWSDFHSANLSGGIARSVVPISQYADPCSNIACYFNEDFYIELTETDLVKALNAKTELAMRIAGDRGDPIVVRVPFSYLVGYSLKLSELYPKLSHIGAVAKAGKEYILRN